jgi:hypothetical protein
VSGTSADAVFCRVGWSLCEPGGRCDVGDAWGETTPPEGRGVPDWCCGKRKQMAATGINKAADSVPGRSAKRVIERRRGITRSKYSERKRKELRWGHRERMAECSAIEALGNSSGKQMPAQREKCGIRERLEISC